MPNRFQTKQYESIAPFLDERDGHYCLVCFIETGQRRGKGINLEIDHADGDRHNWSPSNLHWLCKKHNIKFRSLNSKAHASLVAGYSAENERVRKKNNEYVPETRRKQLYLSGSPEMQVNSVSLIKWLDYMHSMIGANGSISKDDAINAGAIAADDIDIQTTARYYKKHTSILGRFKEIVADGQKMVIYRDEKAYVQLPRASTNGNGNTETHDIKQSMVLAKGRGTNR